MDSKIHLTTLGCIITLLTLTQAYNVSKTYYLNESGGTIVDEIIINGHDNPLLTKTLPGLIIVFFTIFILNCATAIGILAIILFLKK